MAKLVNAGRFGRAFALVPLLSRVGIRGFVVGARDIFRYIVSGRASKKELAILIAAIVYFLSPIDLIPDYIPVIGLADDLTIAMLVAAYLHKKAMEARAGQDAGTS